MEQDADPRYRAVLARLQARGRFGIRLGLGRTRAVLRRMGNPHDGLPGALIGGTNGKGSTQALVAAALREGGYRVGQTPKPHLSSYRERILIDGRAISASDFSLVVEEVLNEADAIAARHGPPTEFEVLTAAAFTWFRRSGVDVAVVEVGLGGRLDATNVWQGGVSALTNVALDHMEYLGDTVEAIAREKAQIIKRGDHRAVTGAKEPALGVIRRRTQRLGVSLALTPPLNVTSMQLDGLHVEAPDGHGLTVGLLGRHQAANAAVALGILDALTEAGIATVPPDTVDNAFARARWAGRLELVSHHGKPDVILDGAHNPAGIAALAEALEELLPMISPSPPTFVMAILANHWQHGMLDPLAIRFPGAALIATNVPDAPNSLDPLRLGAAWGAGTTAMEDTDRALDIALERAAETGGTVVVCGSLYLVGHARSRLGVDDPAD
jgi:dihydrofolate synthase/folylpolyglutamate synthase